MVAAPMPVHTLTPSQLSGGAALAGLSNRDIAGTLHLSVRTAERHSANVYKKIGAHSKAAATVFAFNFGRL